MYIRMISSLKLSIRLTIAFCLKGIDILTDEYNVTLFLNLH